MEKRPLIIFVLALILVSCLVSNLPIDRWQLEKSLQGIPLIYSSIIYILLYVLVSFFIFFSKDLFWLMGAVLFGPFLSALFICIAEYINALILFYLARSLGRAYVEKKLSEKYKKLDEKIGNLSFFWLFIFRVAPLIPYRFLDLAAGLTKIHFRRYFLAVVLGSPLKIFWIQYILNVVGKDIFKNPYILAEYFLNNKGFLVFSFLYVILVVAVVYKIKRASQK